ncbi:Hemolysin precursor [Moraxella caviae]|uniref:Hemolysin n=1 Tax=Moraxella caviae TaxID=34060 RepID=A0A378R731_9GAMM|nr:Hemolysin precursor [Moraxella caviae]STZ13795.1 Hemolysin precursor [Moraxella caviae]
MVVSEKTRLQGKSDNPSVGGSTTSSSGWCLGFGFDFGLKTLSLSLLLSLGLTAHANTPTTIIADKSADKALQPIVLNTASGVVSVNIATPNARGLSNNHYSQFDVGSTGAVLNNNRKAVNTQIAGFVAANPYMARGEASTILNQVNSNNPSHLNGFIEVAGKKADVIIANPSGLVVNGAGFINAGNVHLAAANSQVNHGQLLGYQVGGNHAGKIEVNGKLNLQGTDYAALIAKTAQINDEIYAGKQLDVILGENQVSIQDGNFNQLSAVHQNNDVSSTNQTGTAPALALDISHLGGMYAGKIHLITDKGFGVNNQGVITATGSGQQLGTGTLTLDGQGNLVNTGKILAKDAVTINTHDNTAQNDGTLLSEQADIAINTASLNNTGIIHSTQTAKIAAKEAIENRGSVYGGVLQVHTDKLNNTGQLIQTGTGKLDITTNTLINTDKAVIGQSLYGQTSIPAPSTPSSDQSAGSISSELADNTAGSTGNVGADTQPPALSDSGANTQTKPIPNARGHIIATNSIHNTGDQALITATGDIGISADKTSNTKQASIDVQSLNTNTLVNTDSKIALDDINWQLSRFDNSKGNITARNGMAIDSGSDMINTGGQLSATDAVTLSAVGMLDNTQGVIVSGGDTVISADGVNNQAGAIMSTGHVSVASKDKLTNDKGVISAQANTTLSVGTALSNHDGNVFGNQHLTIHSQDLTNSGQVYGGKSTTLTALRTLDNTQAGLIASAGDTTIRAHTITHAGSIIAGMDREGKLGQPANLSIQSTGNLVSTGTHIATQAMVMTGNMLDLSDSHSEAVNINLNSQTDVNTTNATAIAADTLHISTPGQLNNTQGQLSAKQLVIDGSQLINHQGNISHSGTQALTLSFNQGLDNSQGSISSNSQVLDINTGTAALNNQQGSIAHTGSTLTVSTQHLGNHQGKLLSTGNQSLTVATDINNSQGVIQASHFSMDAKELNNHQGSVFATDETAQSRIALTGNLSNTNGDSNVNADTQAATITTLGALAISANTLDNTGQISTKTLTVDANTINNSGSISSQEAISIHAKDALNNRATGSLYAGTDLTLHSQGHLSHHGNALVGNRFSATAATLDLTDSHNEADSISYDSQGDITHHNASSLAAQNIRINNTQGVLSNQAGNLTAKTVDIHTGSLQNSGVITAKELTISQTKDYTHTSDDTLIADTLTFTTQGNFSNQHNFGATDSLTLTAASIHNHQDATITSSNTTLHSQTNITNQGLINGDTTIVKATNTINNLAGGRIYGTQLAIQADTLNNTPAKAVNQQTNQENDHHTSPVIAARQRLDIGVNTLNNNPNPDRAGKFNEDFDNQALITSLGSLHIGGSLDDNHHATGKAQTVVNKGATIQSGGSMVIGAKTLLNTNADFKKHTVEVVAESARNQTLYRAHKQADTIPAAQKSTDVADLGNKPMAGLFDCPEGSECIVNYDYDSTIWSYFNITAPAEPAPVIAVENRLDEPDLPKNETAESCALADASNQACTQYNEALANYTKAMGPLIKWEADNAAAIESLELAIREYNRQFNQNKSDVDLALNIYTTDEAKLGPTSRKGAPDGALYVKNANGDFYRLTEEVDVITTDFVVYEDKTLASDPARMVAGQNLVIHGDTLINDKSQMNAGAGFAVIGDTVIQTPDNGLYGEKTKVTENGRFTRYSVFPSGINRHKRRAIGGGSFTQSFAPLATYELPILSATINKPPSVMTIDQSALASGDVETVLAALKANQAALSLDAQQQLSKLLTDKEQGQAVDEAVLSELTKALSQSVDAKPVSVISADFSQLTIPSSALYIINADDPNQPLVQTDPAFTDYKQWLGSDYMLKALQSDPNHIHKRLSDGYGEQERIKDQYYLLTGRHINTDYRSNEEAFKQLMDNGITHAKQFGYTLGTALTAEQMANLTTDIVWLVKQSITVAVKDKDGNSITKTQDVLVPKLYLRSANSATGTLTPDGRYAAMSSKSMDIQLTGNLDNNGNIIAKDTANINANNITNDGGVYGNFIAVTADNTIANHGTMYANSAMRLDAGNQIINESQTATHHNKQGQSASSNTAITRIATIRVGDGLKDQTDDNGNPLTTLNIHAGNYVLNKAANIQNEGGNTQITAQNGINITTLTTSNHISAVADPNNYFNYSQSTDVGSTITSAGNLTIATTGKGAGITVEGSSLQSGGTTAVVATGDVSISEGRQTERVESASLHTNRRLTGSKTERSSFGQYSDKSLISQVGGNQVVIQGVNTSLISTEVLADKDILIKADNQLLIGSAKDNASGHSSHEVTKKGLFATSPTSVTLGKQRTQNQADAMQTTYTGSLIGTTGGNVSLVSNDSLVITNSDVIAQKDGANTNTGNIYIQATDATIQSQNAISDNSHRFAQKTTGVTASVSSSLVSEVQSLETLKESVNDTDSRKAKLAGTLAAASKVRTLAKDLKGGNLGSIRVQATIGSQSTKSQTTSHQETNDAANLLAQNNLIVNLKGKGVDSDLTVTGSNLTVGNNFYQSVEGDVLYQASTQTDTQDSQNSSKGWGAGVYASSQIGSGQSNQGFTINANKAKGSSSETTTTHTNTQVTVGGTTVNDIGGNLILDGANLDTKHLTGTVGGDLLVNSRQDGYQYTHDQKQAGFSADVGFDGKPQSFSINGGKTDVDADYAQVTHQSGIKANQSTLSVQGQGKFTGGYLITDAGKNQTQFAQGIQTQDIENHLNYEGDAISVGIGIGADTSNPNGKAKPALQGIGYGTIDPVNKTSTTHAAITDQAGLSHINTENFKQEEVQNQLNEIITNDFDKEQATKELDAQVTITQAFDAERRAIRSEFAKEAEDYRKKAEKLSDDNPEKFRLEQQAQDIEQKLRIFDSITSALYAPNSNGIIGDVARAASPELAYRIGQEFKRKDQEGSAQHLLAHAVLGAAVSYATGNDIATGAMSGAANEAGAKVLANYLYQGKDPQDLTQEQKDTITSILNLATATTIYTTTDGSTTDAVSGAEIGKVGMENNANIFINGHWNRYAGNLEKLTGGLIPNLSPAGPGKEKYWDWMGGKSFVPSVKEFLESENERDIFIDGSSLVGMDQDGKDRFKLGYQEVNKNIDKYNSLLKSPHETFKIISHSEGGAYGAGMAKALIDKGYKVETVLSLSPDEATDYSVPRQPTTYQIHSNFDIVSPFAVPRGTDYVLLLTDSKNVMETHTRTVSTESINRLKNYLKRLGGGKNSFYDKKGGIRKYE